jgi:hypothetical protein
MNKEPYKSRKQRKGQPFIEVRKNECQVILHAMLHFRIVGTTLPETIILFLWGKILALLSYWRV